MATGRSIDHVVLAARDLDEAARAYEGLGFTLTPRAHHEDRMGTSNRLAQLAGESFIELLEVDRPERLEPHDAARTPPFFSFGAHNRSAVAERDGLSMLVFASDDARADIARFAAAGSPGYAPFDFERQARLPDGGAVTVSFSLAFATSPDMPKPAFFVCQNRAPQHFWKPAFQTHANGATAVRAVYLASPAPERDAAFVARLFGGATKAIAGGLSVACGAAQEVRVVSPETVRAIDPSFPQAALSSPVLAGLALVGDAARETTPSAAACGAFLEWEAG